MSSRTPVFIALSGLCLLWSGVEAPAQDQKAQKPPEGDSVARYCASAGPAASEIRVARQIKRLTELEGQIQSRIRELDQKEAEARDWVSKREAMMKKATDEVVTIFGKMEPEAAATRLALLEDESAAAILAKMPPRAASAILNDMEASRAGKLTTILLGPKGGDKKS